MLVHTKIGSSNRLKEIFENVNKVKINEDFFKPEDKEEEEAVTPEDITGDVSDEEGEGVEHGEEPPSDNPSIEPDYAAEPETAEADAEAVMGDMSPQDDAVALPGMSADGEEPIRADDPAGMFGGQPPEGEALEGGVGDGAEVQQFNPEQVAIGVRTEMEHTGDPKIALEIALDHLTELPDYYTRLDTMETDAITDAPQDQDGGSEEEAIVFGKNDAWVDSYKPVGVGEDINYPHPVADPEAGEEEFDFAEKAKQGEFEENPEDDSLKNSI